MAPELKGYNISTVGNTLVCDKDSLKLNITVNNNYSINQTISFLNFQTVDELIIY